MQCFWEYYDPLTLWSLTWIAVVEIILVVCVSVRCVAVLVKHLWVCVFVVHHQHAEKNDEDDLQDEAGGRQLQPHVGARVCHLLVLLRWEAQAWKKLLFRNPGQKSWSPSLSLRHKSVIDAEARGCCVCVCLCVCEGGRSSQTNPGASNVCVFSKAGSHLPDLKKAEPFLVQPLLRSLKG